LVTPAVLEKPILYIKRWFDVAINEG